ncbi:MAG: hypothetical protein PHD81_02045 [Candidatus Nanoarchaeia archaeon]|nr:hypothetical protein [Candidatus Nanoarchaeia archaeon]MDD5587871.1 hypothetical protein [Candidatus Nanoarchaeia archaeon]
MPIKISAIGYGLAAILGAGAVILAGLNNPNWYYFLGASLLALVLSILLRKL